MKKKTVRSFIKAVNYFIRWICCFIDSLGAITCVSSVCLPASFSCFAQNSQQAFIFWREPSGQLKNQLLWCQFSRLSEVASLFLSDYACCAPLLWKKRLLVNECKQNKLQTRQKPHLPVEPAAPAGFFWQKCADFHHWAGLLLVIGSILQFCIFKKM